MTMEFWHGPWVRRIDKRGVGRTILAGFLQGFRYGSVCRSTTTLAPVGDINLPSLRRKQIDRRRHESTTTISSSESTDTSNSTESSTSSSSSSAPVPTEPHHWSCRHNVGAKTRTITRGLESDPKDGAILFSTEDLSSAKLRQATQQLNVSWPKFQHCCKDVRCHICKDTEKRADPSSCAVCS